MKNAKVRSSAKSRWMAGTIAVFGLIFAISGSLCADTWSQTTFTDGSFSNTITSMGNADVILPVGGANTGNGADGTLNVNAADFNLNTQTQQAGRGGIADAVNFSTTGVLAVGNTSVTLSVAPTGLAANDEILIINLKGSPNVGNYETKNISSIVGNTLNLTLALTKDYGDSATQKIMVQRVPNYTDVTVAGGRTLTANSWDGTKGGVLFFRATGTVTMTGSINMVGKGWAGGVAYGAGEGLGAGGGASIPGSGGSAGYAVAGAIGSDSHGGAPGAAYGTANLNKIYFGSGGGGSSSGWGDGSGRAGGAGGGIILLSASQLNVTGNIKADGATGVQGGFDGGSGSGGSIYLSVNILSIGANLVTAIGGTPNWAGGFTGGYPADPVSAGRVRIDYAFPINGNTNPAAYTQQIPAPPPGTFISPAIALSGISYWGVVHYTINSPTNTSITVDVISASNNALLQANIPNGTDIQAAYPVTFANITGIKLRANLSTYDPTTTSMLSDWRLEYATGTAVTTTNWTDLTQGKAVQMGQSTAQVKFEMKTLSGNAKWKRFRIDKGLKSYTNIACPDNKIEVQVWCDTNNNSFFDTGDTLISKGNFTNGTCYLNMKQWQVTTASKTYYIVYKLASDISGGTRAGVKITDSSYLEFENATTIGVPP